VSKKTRKKPARKAKKASTDSWFEEERKHLEKIQSQKNVLPDNSADSRNRVAFYDCRGREIERLTQIPSPDFKRSVSLPHEEWDFRACPEEEWDMCLEYELSREVPLWRTMVHNYRLIEGRNPTAVLNLIMYFSHLVNLVSFPEWPVKPWLALKQRSMQKNPLEAWRSLFADCDSLAEDAPPPSKITNIEIKYGKPYLYGNLQIDLSQNPTLIKRQFSNWLTHWGTKCDVKPVERRGKRTAAKFLQWLGVYRLLKAMPWEKAQIKLQRRGIETYASHPSLIHASDKAIVVIGRFALEKMPPPFPLGK
jgi:hypothetical protein